MAGLSKHLKTGQKILVLTLSFLLIFHLVPSSWAATRSATWTTKGDFENNASTTGTLTTKQNVKVSGINPTEDADITLANDIDFNKRTIATGWCHTAGVREDGTAVAVTDWGNSDVSAWQNIKAIAVGHGHIIGLKEDGTVVAIAIEWPLYGQTSLSSWTNIKAIAAGKGLSVGLRQDGTVVARGDNYLGQANVSSWSNIKDIDAEWEHTVGLKEDGTVVAVGRNTSGQLNVASWTNIKAIAAGSNHTVGLKEDGTVVAVGWNKYGQTNVSSWSNIVAVAAGAEHTVGLKRDGSVVVAGCSRTDVSGWRNIKAIAAGGYNTIGLRGDGMVEGRSDVSGWSNIRQPSYFYPSSGSVSGLKISARTRDKVKKFKFKKSKIKKLSILWNASTPPNTAIKFRVRGIDSEASIASATWSNHLTTSGSSVTGPFSQWLEVEVTLESTDGVSTPVLYDFTVNYK